MNFFIFKRSAVQNAKFPSRDTDVFIFLKIMTSWYLRVTWYTQCLACLAVIVFARPPCRHLSHVFVGAATDQNVVAIDASNPGPVRFFWRTIKARKRKDQGCQNNQQKQRVHCVRACVHA